MRHAERFVRMGDAAWFDHHGFEQSRAMPAPLFLEIRVNRPMPVFEFLEPVVVELKLQNISAMPQVVDENILTALDGITRSRRQGSPARQFLPFAQCCMKSAAKVLQPKEAIYSSVYVTAGLNGVDVDRTPAGGDAHAPGGHRLEAVHAARGDPERDGRRSRRAGLLPDKVSRVLAFDGSRVLPQANKVLRDVVERLPDRRVARHARIPLGLAVAEPAKVLTIGAGAAPGAAATKALQGGGGTASTRRVGVEGGADEPRMSRQSRSGTWTIRCTSTI